MRHFRRARITGGDYFEWSVAIGTITDTDFLVQMRPEVEENLRYIRNKAVLQVMNWCWDYHDKYGKAPGLYIKEMFEDKREDLEPSEEDIISDLLGKLSEKYEQDEEFDAAYEIEKVRRALRTAWLEETTKEVGRLLREGQLDEAQEMILKEGIWAEETSGLDDDLIEVTKFISSKVDRPVRLIRPWLSCPSLNMVYGDRGVGKSWFCHMVSVLLTRSSIPDDFVESWHMRKSKGVLLVDGEMSKPALHQRLGLLCSCLGNESPDSPFLMIAKNLNLSYVRARNALGGLLNNNDKIKLLILDNISCLFSGLDENSKEAWDPINRWLLSLRASGLGIILVHHSGKSGKQRGTSGREDAMDTIIRLHRPKEYDPSDGAKFVVSYDKARNAPPDANLRSFELEVRDLLGKYG